MIDETYQELNQKELDEKILRVFGDVSIHKMRLPSTKLDKKGIPGFVAEWAIDMIAPGVGELSPRRNRKDHQLDG